jgi:nucleotide-binding universal stress UspA family protein
MYRKILVVVDDRVVTQSAIRQAIEIARALRADVYFLSILPGHGALSNEGVQSQLVTHTNSLLAAARELAEEAGIQSFVATSLGSDVAQGVSDVAERKHCDLIVVAAEVRNPVLQIFSSSFVPKLLSVTSVPLLVCQDTGLNGGFGRRVSVSIRARQRRLELLERRKRESND